MIRPHCLLKATINSLPSFNILTIRAFSVAVFLSILGCTLPPALTDAPPNPEIRYSPDRLSATLTTDGSFSGLDSIKVFLEPVSGIALLNKYASQMDDSARALLAPVVEASIPSYLRDYRFHSVKQTKTLQFYFTADTARLRIETNQAVSAYDPLKPIEPLFDQKGLIPQYLSAPKGIFVLPCVGYPLPREARFLPNSPRAYRSGIHRGIDFIAPWGTPVRAVADGVIIRSDLWFKEINSVFREKSLFQAKRLKRTPSDIFNSILLGRAVIIDHGFDLFPGFRAITIYAHLSHVDSKMEPGTRIKQGEVFGRTGNTGLQESTNGNRGGAHLHWELILQDAEGEYFFGQGLKYNELVKALNKLFRG